MDFDYTKGFATYYKSDRHKQFPVDWLYSEEHSTENDKHYLAYDGAFLQPLNDIDTWKPHAIKETCETISEMFKDSDKNIYLDGFKLDIKNKKLGEYYK